MLAELCNLLKTADILLAFTCLTSNAPVSIVKIMLDSFVQQLFSLVFPHALWFVVAIMLGVWFRSFWKREHKTRNQLMLIILASLIVWLFLYFLLQASLPEDSSSPSLLSVFFSPASFLVGFVLGVLIQQQTIKQTGKKRK